MQIMAMLPCIVGVSYLLYHLQGRPLSFLVFRGRPTAYRYLSAMPDKFYHSKRWERKRAFILRRDGYKCQISKRYGKAVPATTVHHIFPREDYPQYQWKDWNLISVSTEVHNRLHYRQTQTLTEEGLKLKERTARIRGLAL